MAGWARWFAIVLAGLDAIAQVGLITFVPAWSLLVIAINVLIIYGPAAKWDIRSPADPGTGQRRRAGNPRRRFPVAAQAPTVPGSAGAGPFGSTYSIQAGSSPS
ncbi:MAG: DUF7144 family membrane protein [Frankiaceae bacterium]